MWETHFPPFPGLGTRKSLACKIARNLPAHTVINDSSNNLTPIISLNNIDAPVLSSESVKPRGSSYLKDMCAQHNFGPESVPLKRWEKFLHKERWGATQTPSEQMYPWMVTLGVDIMLQQCSLLRPGSEPALFCSQDFFFTIFFLFYVEDA